MTLFWWSSSVPDGDFLIITQEKFSKTKVSGYRTLSWDTETLTACLVML